LGMSGSHSTGKSLIQATVSLLDSGIQATHRFVQSGHTMRICRSKIYRELIVCALVTGMPLEGMRSHLHNVCF
jgi:hypothetical protein